MKVGTTLLIVASAALVSGCEPCFSCCGDVEVGLSLVVHNSEGQSMFDSSTPGYFHKDSIVLFTLENGKLSTIMDKDRYFRIEPSYPSGDTVANISPHTNLSDKKKSQTLITTTVVRWSAHDSDTIDFEIVEKCYKIRQERVWFNGRLAEERPVQVTK